MKIKTNKTQVIILIIITLVFIGLRIVHFNSDPIQLSWSEGIYTDIGFYIHNARSGYLFGEMEFGDWDNRVLFPVFNNIMYYVFQVFGCSTKVLVLFTVFICLLSTYFFSYFNNITISTRAGLITFIFYTFNFIWIAFSRVAVMEVYALFFISISMLLLISERTIHYFQLGVFAALAVFCKLSSVFIIPIVLLTLVFDLIIKKHDKLDILKRTLSFLTPFSIIVISWYRNLYRLDHSIIDYTLYNKGASLKNFIYFFNNFHTNFYFRMPVVTLFSGLGLIFCFRKIKCLYEIKKTDFIMLMWLLIYFIQLTISFYNPPRFLLYLLPPMIYFCTKILNYFFIKEKIEIKLNRIIITVSVILFYLISYSFIWTFFRSGLNRHILAVYFHIYAGCMTIILIILFLIIIRFRLLNILRNKYLGILIIIFSILFGMYQYSKWFKNVTYSTYRISKDLEKIIPYNSVLAGWWAPQLGINNKIKTLPSYNSHYWYFRKNKVTHLIVNISDVNVRRRLREHNVKFVFIKEYIFLPIKRRLLLYKLDWQ